MIFHQEELLAVLTMMVGANISSEQLVSIAERTIMEADQDQVKFYYLQGLEIIIYFLLMRINLLIKGIYREKLLSLDKGIRQFCQNSFVQNIQKKLLLKIYTPAFS